MLDLRIRQFELLLTVQRRNGQWNQFWIPNRCPFVQHGIAERI